MKKSFEKVVRLEYASFPSNKEFLLKFLNQNFQRQSFSLQTLRSFNYYLSQQCNRIYNNFSTLAFEISVASMLLSSFISNLEQLCNNPSLFSALNDTFYLMMQFVSRSLTAFNAEKSFTDEAWLVVDEILNLFEILSRPPALTSEPMVGEENEKKIMEMVWVDEEEDFTRCSKIVMKHDERLESLLEVVACPEKERHILIIKSSFACYLRNNKVMISENLMQLLEHSFVNKKSKIVKKILDLFVTVSTSTDVPSISTNPNPSSHDLSKLFNKVLLENTKNKSIKQHRQFLHSIDIEKYISAEQIFTLIYEMIRESLEVVPVSTMKQVDLFLEKLKHLSFIFSEVTTEFEKRPENKLSLYDILIRLLRLLSQKPHTEENKMLHMKSICENVLVIFNNSYGNLQIRETLKVTQLEFCRIMILLSSEADINIQKLVLKTLPYLVDFIPVNGDSSGQNGFSLAIYLKMFIFYINNLKKYQEIPKLFQKFYSQSQDIQKITNYDFAIYLCFWNAIIYWEKEKMPTIELLMDTIIRKLEKYVANDFADVVLLLDFVLLIGLVNDNRTAVLRVSAKEFTDCMLHQQGLIGKTLSLPVIQTNETSLFTPHETVPLNEKIVTINNLLTTLKPTFANKTYADKFYQILYEINYYTQKYHLSNDEQHQNSIEIVTMNRMKIFSDSTDIPVICQTLRSSTRQNNKIEMFYCLMKIYKMILAVKDDFDSFVEFQVELFSMFEFIFKSHVVTDMDILKIYKGKLEKKFGNADEMNQFISDNKDLEIARYYSLIQRKTSKLHLFIIELATKILIKLYNPIRSPKLAPLEFKQLHLLYLPIQSPYFKNLHFQNELQIIFIEAYLISIRNEELDEFRKEMKQHILMEYNKVVALYSQNCIEIRKIVEFKEFSFLQFLLQYFMEQYALCQNDRCQENNFVFTMVYLLSSDPYILKLMQQEIKGTDWFLLKVPLVLKRVRVQVITEKYSTENSKAIYGLLDRMTPAVKPVNFNEAAIDLINGDDFKCPQFSIYVCKQLILMKKFIQGDENMANKIFQYVGAMYEFYQRFSGNEKLLLIVPQMICELFRINEPRDSEFSSEDLRDFERIDRPHACSKYSSNTGYSYFRCAQCESSGDKRTDEKKLICEACILSCHKNHVYYFVPSNSRSQCLCASSGVCKFKSSGSAPVEMKKKEGIVGEFGRPLKQSMRAADRLNDLPRQFRDIREMREAFRENLMSPGAYKIRGVYDPNDDGGQSNPISFFQPYNEDSEEIQFSKKYVERYYDKYHRERDLNDNWDEEFGDSEPGGVGLFKPMAMGNKRRREKDIRNSNLIRNHDRLTMLFEAHKELSEEIREEKLQEKVEEKFEEKLEQKLEIQSFERLVQNQMIQMSLVEEQEDSQNQYERNRELILMQTEEEKNTIIKSHSYLIHIFLGIVEERFSKQNRKISIHEAPIWKLPTQPPILTKLSENVFKIYTTNFKNKMNIDSNNSRASSPMIVRKPIAISEKLIFILCSQSIFAFDAKKFLMYICNSTTTSLPETLYRHDLSIEAHSIQFIPNYQHLVCVCGLKTMQVLSINSSNVLSKSLVNSYDNNSGEVINKMQVTEIGILISDARAIKLIDLNTRTVLITIPAPKQGGVIRDWCAVEEIASPLNYNLLVITSYGSIFQVQFDENDRGEKQLNKKLAGYNKKKDETGVSIFQSYLHDGRKIMMAGVKDSQSNLISIIENDVMQTSVLHKFNTLCNHPSLFGHMLLIESTPERILLACTLKDGSNREMSIHAGTPFLLSLTKQERLEMQALLYHGEVEKAQGLFAWNIDKDIKLIISLAEDGSLYMHSVGKLMKQNVMKFLTKTEDNIPVPKEQPKDAFEIMKILFAELKLDAFEKVQLNPMIDFFDKTEFMKRGADYTCDMVGDQYWIYLNNYNRMVTGISFNRSCRVVLPTRTIENTLEVAFSHLECLYYLSHGLHFKTYKATPSYQRSIHQNEDKKKQFQFYLYGEQINNSNPKVKKAQTISSRFTENNSLHIPEIFKIIKIFLKEIKYSCNYIFEDTELKGVIDSLKGLLAQVNEDYYSELREVIVLAVQIYGAMVEEKDPRADSWLHPWTFVTETVVKEIDSLNIHKVDLLLGNLCELTTHHPDVFFYLIMKYTKLLPKIFKKYSTHFSKQHDNKERYKLDAEITLPPCVQPLLDICIASLNLQRKNAERDETLLIIKNIFARYSASRSVSLLLYNSLKKYYSDYVPEWVLGVKSVDGEAAEQVPIEQPIAIDPEFKNLLGLAMGKYDNYLSEEELLAMEEDERCKFEFMFENMEIEEEEEKLEEENQGEMGRGVQEIKELKGMVMEEEGSESSECGIKSNIISEVFMYCMRPLDNEDSYETAYDYILMAEICYKATEYTDPQASDLYFKYISEFLKKHNPEKPLQPVTVAYLSLFSKMIHRSVFLENQTSEYYDQIKSTVLKLVDAYILKEQGVKTKSCIRLSHVKKQLPIDVNKINIPHTLLYLLRRPVEAPCVLFVKFYALLPHKKEYYQEERDRVIFEKCMRQGDIETVYKKAKKDPEIWKKLDATEWLERMIAEQNEGWELALELLTLYYDE